MTAILQTKGPIVTPTVTKHSWRFLSMMSTKQFLRAAEELQRLDLGSLVSLGGVTKKGPTVFIKKPPAEIESALLAHPDLCALEYYAHRYNMHITKSLQCISLHVRHSVAKMGLAPAKLLV